MFRFFFGDYLFFLLGFSLRQIPTVGMIMKSNQKMSVVLEQVEVVGPLGSSSYFLSD